MNVQYRVHLYVPGYLLHVDVVPVAGGFFSLIHILHRGGVAHISTSYCSPHPPTSPPRLLCKCFFSSQNYPEGTSRTTWGSGSPAVFHPDEKKWSETASLLSLKRVETCNHVRGVGGVGSSRDKKCHYFYLLCCVNDIRYNHNHNNNTFTGGMHCGS